MRVFVILVLLVAARAADAECPRTCPATEKDEYGCCPAAKPTPKPVPTVRAPAPKPKRPTTDPKRLELRKAAEVLEAEAKRSFDTSKLVACGTAYVDLYNQDPTATDSDEVLWNAASCFELGKSVDGAIKMYRLLIAQHATSTFAHRAMGRLGILFASIAFFEEAATYLEQYAAKYPDEAFESLGDALYYRRGLGDDSKAIEDANRFVKLFATKRPLQAAEAHFQVLPIYEKQGVDQAVKRLREYIRLFGERGGVDRIVAAHARIGQLLWRKACPVSAIEGVCARIVRDPPLLANARRRQRLTRCSPDSVPRFESVARDATLVRDAITAFKAAIAAYDQRGTKLGSTEPGALHHSAIARIGLVDVEIEKHLAVPVPKNLDFSSADKPTREDSLKRFNTFVKHVADAAPIRARYDAIVKLGDARSAVEATAKTARSALHVAWTVGSIEIPRDVDTDEKVHYFCNQLQPIVDKRVEEATAALVTCTSQANQLGVVDDWSEVCERELQQLDPEKYPTLVESLPAPTRATPQPELAGPLPMPSAFATVATEFAKYEAATWNTAACSKVASQFIATRSDPALAHYMAGLTFHRCSMVKEATTAYSNALAANPKLAVAYVNLGALAFADQPSAAIVHWQKAVAADPKLHAAQFDLALGKLIEVRMYAPSDARFSTARAEAQKAASSALAIQSDSARAYLVLALVYFEGTDRNGRQLDLARLLLDEAKRIDAKNRAVHNAFGVLSILRRSSAAAIASFQQAAGDPDATYNHARVLFTLRKWNEANALLQKLPVSYAQQLAVGVAARGAKRYADADAAYRKASTLEPKSAAPHLNLGILHKDFIAATMTDLEKAIPTFRVAKAHFERALASPSGTPDLFNQAKAEIAVTDKTIDQIEKYLRVQKQTPPKKP